MCLIIGVVVMCEWNWGYRKEVSCVYYLWVGWIVFFMVVYWDGGSILGEEDFLVVV